MMIFIEMFSGIGGFRLGLERSGWRCVWANDWDKWANLVYKKKFGNGELVEGDIREIEADTIPDCDLLTAGFPCQSFSVAGKRKGIRESRGTLFYHIARVASAKKPKLLLLENVKGILSSESGRTFAIILRILDGLGYDVEWQVLNSKHFGVPQNRERVFIVGYLRGTSSQQIFPIATSSEAILPIPIYDRKGFDSRTKGFRKSEKQTPALTQKMGTGGNNVPMVVQLVGDRDKPSVSIKNEAFCLPSNPMSDRQQFIIQQCGKFKSQHGRGLKLITDVSFTLQSSRVHGILEVGNIYPSGGEAGKIINPEGIFPTLKQGKRGGKAGIPPIMLISQVGDVRGLNQQQDRIYDVDGIAPSLRKSEDRERYNILTDAKIRRLTPIECERLQGFPDNWTQGVSDTQRYKLLGNAVTVNVIEYLGERLKRCLSN